MAQINSKLTPSGSVTLPSSGSVAFFTEAADAGRLYIKDSEGNVYPAVDASGSGGISSIQVNYTGSEVGDATILDFEGSGINDITVSGTTATINVSGGGSGSSGTSGASGAAGADGTSGTSGANGAAGANGTSGSSGATGDNGTSGSSGADGTSGSSGADGTSGSSGENGATGAAGTSGSSGINGTSGSSGETGASGTSGSSGETGASGTSGSSGETGASGTSGESGTSGSSGADGTSGSSGEQGIQGNPGTSGSSGANGTSGSSGEDGATGAAGTSGSSGEDGATGAAGTSGSSGANGTSGSSGEDGATGAAGTSGSSGVNGTSGSSGETGATGNAGTSGSSGANGTDGTSGSSGATGNAGTSGSSGADGAPGAGGGASFNPIIRYEVTSGSNIAQIMSSGNVEGGLSWTRSTTTLTVTHTAHGLSAGDFVVIRNMSEDYSYLEIQSVTTNTFTLTVANSGGTSGTEGAYIPAFDVTSLTDTALTFASPSAGNVQMISCTIFIDQMEDASITVTVPSNAITNGAGKNNSLNSRVPASFDYYDVSGTTSSKVGSATLSFSTTANHNVYSLSGGLDIFGDALYTLQF